MVEANRENDTVDTGPAERAFVEDFEVINLCDNILGKVSQLTKHLVPVLREDDGTTPDAREGSPVIMKLQAIDGHLEKLMKRIDL